MEAGHAGLHQQGHEHGQFLLHYTGVAVMGVLLPDSQLVVNGHAGHSGVHCLDSFHGKAGAALGTAAVFIGAVVEDGGREAAAHPVAVHLHHVKARLLCQHSSLAKARDDLMDLFLGHLGDVGAHGIVHPLPQLVGGDLFHQHPRNALDDGHHVGIGLVELGADLAAVFVGSLADLLIEGKALFVKQGLLKPALGHRHVADDDHGAATLGQPLHLRQIFLVRKAEGGGSKDDAVLQLHSTVINGAQDGVVHVTHSLSSSVLPFAAGSGAGAVPLRSARSDFVHPNRKIPGGRSGMLSHPPGSAPNDNCGPAFPGS